MTLKGLTPKRDERMMIVGASGTGKTTLARAILSPFPRVLVIDPKCTYGGAKGEEGYTMVRSPFALRRLKKADTHIQFRPDIESQHIEAYNAVYEWVYRRGDIMVYTDEVYLVMNKTQSPPFLTYCITCGRELGVGMINGSQRPKGVDKRIFTESNRFAAFRLMDYQDTKTMTQAIGDEVLTKPTGHAFWYREVGWDSPKLLQLKL